jgi:hypothetical protein
VGGTRMRGIRPVNFLSDEFLDKRHQVRELADLIYLFIYRRRQRLRFCRTSIVTDGRMLVSNELKSIWYV